MSSAEIMDHILGKTQLDDIMPRVLNNRQLRKSLMRGFIQGPYGMKVKSWMPTLWETGLACVWLAAILRPGL